MVKIEYSALQVDEDRLTKFALFIHNYLSFPDDVDFVNGVTPILDGLTGIKLSIGDAYDKVVDKLLLAAIQYCL